MKFKISIYMITAMLFSAISIVSCGNDSNDEPSIYDPTDPAGEVEGTYVGTFIVENKLTSETYEDVSFVFRKESIGSLYYDIIRKDGKMIRPNASTTVWYYKDESIFKLGAIGENGTISRNGKIKYTGDCSVNGVAGYTFTFNGQRK